MTFSDTLEKYQKTPLYVLVSWRQGRNWNNCWRNAPSAPKRARNPRPRAALDRALAARRLAALALVALGLGGFLLGQVAPAEASGHRATLITIDGTIDELAAGHLARGLADARENGARLAIVRLDTPGGLYSSTREIVEHCCSRRRSRSRSTCRLQERRLPRPAPSSRPPPTSPPWPRAQTLARRLPSAAEVRNCPRPSSPRPHRMRPPSYAALPTSATGTGRCWRTLS